MMGAWFQKHEITPPPIIPFKRYIAKPEDFIAQLFWRDTLATWCTCPHLKFLFFLRIQRNQYFDWQNIGARAQGSRHFHTHTVVLCKDKKQVSRHVCCTRMVNVAWQNVSCMPLKDSVLTDTLTAQRVDQSALWVMIGLSNPVLSKCMKCLKWIGSQCCIIKHVKGLTYSIETVVWHVVYLYTCVLFREMHSFVYEKPLITAIWMKTFSRFKWLFIHFFLLLMQRLLYSLDVLFKKPVINFAMAGNHKYISDNLVIFWQWLWFFFDFVSNSYLIVKRNLSFLVMFGVFFAMAYKCLYLANPLPGWCTCVLYRKCFFLLRKQRASFGGIFLFFSYFLWCCWYFVAVLKKVSWCPDF